MGSRIKSTIKLEGLYDIFDHVPTPVLCTHKVEKKVDTHRICKTPKSNCQCERQSPMTE